MATSTNSVPVQYGNPNGTVSHNLFGVPTYSAIQSEVSDSNNQNVGVTLSSSNSVAAPMSKLDTLDIVTGLVADVAIDATVTPGAGEVLTPSPLYPFNYISNVTLQLEATAITHNANGFLSAQAADIWPVYGPNGRGQVQGAALYNGPNGLPQIYGTSYNLKPSDFTFQSSTTNKPNLTVEIATSMHFDEYFEMTPAPNTGSSAAQPFVPQLGMTNYILGPTYMAATNRVAIPRIVFNPLTTTTSLADGVVGKALADTTTTASGTASIKLNRIGYIYDSTNAEGNPPLSNWIPTFLEVPYPTSGQNSVKIQLSNNGAASGQVLAVIGYIWDPALNGGLGGMVPLSAVESYTLNLGGKMSTIVHTNQGLQRRWEQQHNSALFSNVFGIDFTIDPDGKTTNTYAINTYVQSNSFIQINFVSGQAPSSAAVVVTGQKVLSMIVGGFN